LLADGITVNISQTSSNSANIALFCGENSTNNTMEFVLELRQPTTLALICERNEAFPNLEPGMYTLERRYSNEVLCEVTTFNIEGDYCKSKGGSRKGSFNLACMNKHAKIS
jgi:hypothetical protein